MCCIFAVAYNKRVIAVLIEDFEYDPHAQFVRRFEREFFARDRPA